MSIARNLKRLMDENAVSVSALSADSGIEKTFLTKYLAGKVIPSESVLARLARSLGCEIESITADPKKRTAGKIRPEDAARRLNRSAQDIRIGLQQGFLPFGIAYKRSGSSTYTYEIDPGKLEDYAQRQENFWAR